MGSVTSSSKFVSVIMAAYNAEETIEAAIRSILLQTHDNFELIICDDASTDSTWCLMRSLADEDSRIRLIRQEKNRGSAVARNRCLLQAQGEYIAIMDADDLCSENRLAVQVSFLEKHREVAFVGLLGEVFHNIPGDCSKCYPYVAKPAAKDFLMTLPFVHASLMFRSTTIGRGYPEERRALRSEDYAFLMERYAAGLRGENTTDAVYYIREDADTFKRRKYRYRLTEVGVKWKGFSALGLMPKGILFAIKPLIVGLLPPKLLKLLKGKYYGVRGRVV